MQSKTRQTGIFLVAYIAYTSIYLARLNLSLAKPALDALGQLSTAQLALLGSVFSIVYAVGRMANGAIGDRVKPWVMICGGLLFAGAGNITLSFLPPFPAFLAMWAVNAYGQSMLWSAILCVVAQTYGEQSGKKAAQMVTSVATGNIAAILIVSFILSRFDVRLAFLLPGAFTLLCGAAAFIAFRRIERVQPQADAPQKPHLSFFRMFTVKEIALMLLPAVIHGAMKDNISLFMADYFVTDFGVDPTKNPLYILFIPVVGLLGRLAYPAVQRLCGNSGRRAMLVSFAVCLAAAALLAGGWCPAVVATVCLSVIYAFVSVINTFVLSIFPMRFAASGNVSSVSGMMDFATYTGHAVSSAIFGVTISRWGYGSMFLVWAVISALACAVVLCMIRKRS